MTNPHERIFLQWENHSDWSAITWCEDRVEDDDVEYVRIDLYDKLQAENIAMQTTLDAVGGAGWHENVPWVDDEPTH